MQGAVVRANYDLCIKAGAALVATSEDFPVQVANGRIAVGVRNRSTNNPQINAIEVLTAA